MKMHNRLVLSLVLLIAAGCATSPAYKPHRMGVSLAPQLALCDVALSEYCNTSSPQGNGTQGDQLWMVGGKYNADFSFLAPAWALPGNALLGNPTSSTGGLGSIVAGSGITISGGIISSTGGGGSTSPGGTTGYIQYNNSGVFGGLQFVPIANGGTGTSSPALVAGTNVTITGSWPNQTINSSGSGGGGLSASGTPVAFQTPCWASSTTISAFGPGTSGQVLTSNGAGSCPSFQSGTTYAGLAANTVVTGSDLLAGYPSGGPLGSYTANQLLLFVPLAAVSSATSVTPSCAVDWNDGTVTVTGGTYTVNAPTGCTPIAGQRLTLDLKFTNAQTYSWNAAFCAGATALPTTSTGGGKEDLIAFRYSTVKSCYLYVATAPGF